MTASEFKAALAALDWTQVRAAQHLGFKLTALNNWACGRQKVPRSVAVHLRRLVFVRMTHPHIYQHMMEATQ